MDFDVIEITVLDVLRRDTFTDGPSGSRRIQYDCEDRPAAWRGHEARAFCLSGVRCGNGHAHCAAALGKRTVAVDPRIKVAIKNPISIREKVYRTIRNHLEWAKRSIQEYAFGPQRI